MLEPSSCPVPERGVKLHKKWCRDPQSIRLKGPKSFVPPFAPHIQQQERQREMWITKRLAEFLRETLAQPPLEGEKTILYWAERFNQSIAKNPEIMDILREAECKVFVRYRMAFQAALNVTHPMELHTVCAETTKQSEKFYEHLATVHSIEVMDIPIL